MFFKKLCTVPKIILVREWEANDFLFRGGGICCKICSRGGGLLDILCPGPGVEEFLHLWQKCLL